MLRPSRFRLLTRRQACAASPHFAFPPFFSPYPAPPWPPTMASSSSCPRSLRRRKAPLRAPASAPRSGARARTIRRRLHRSAADRRPRCSRSWPPQMQASPRRTRKPSPSRSSAGRKSTIRDRRRQGPIVVDTPDRFLFLVEPNGKALRYGIGVGRPGFEWSGVKRISRKSEWPDWTPPREMLLRRPDLPRHMAGGPDNPLGARALYLGVLALPHSRHQRAVDHRPQRLVRLHPDDERGRDRPLRSRHGRRRR